MQWQSELHSEPSVLAAGAEHKRCAKGRESDFTVHMVIIQTRTRFLLEYIESHMTPLYMFPFESLFFFPAPLYKCANVIHTAGTHPQQ